MGAQVHLVLGHMFKRGRMGQVVKSRIDFVGVSWWMQIEKERNEWGLSDHTAIGWRIKCKHEGEVVEFKEVVDWKEVARMLEDKEE